MGKAIRLVTLFNLAYFCIAFLVALFIGSSRCSRRILAVATLISLTGPGVACEEL